MPIPPALIPALISAIPGVAQTLTGLAQKNKSKDILSGLEQPEYVIPSAAEQALQTARVGASSFNMAGQTNLEQAQDQVYADTTSDIGAMASSGPEALAALVNAGKNRASAQNEIGFQAAQDYAARQRALQSALGTYAGYQDKAFDINVMQPFEQKAATASALGNAGINNTYSGVNSLAGVAANYFKSLNTDSSGGDMFGAAKGIGKSATTAAASASNNYNEQYDLQSDSQKFLEGINPDTLADLLTMLADQPSAQFGLYGPNSAVQPGIIK
jgi:hypothetical protein